MRPVLFKGWLQLAFLLLVATPVEHCRVSTLLSYWYSFSGRFDLLLFPICSCYTIFLRPFPNLSSPTRAGFGDRRERKSSLKEMPPCFKGIHSLLRRQKRDRVKKAGFAKEAKRVTNLCFTYSFFFFLYLMEMVALLLPKPENITSSTCWKTSSEQH